jgi:hypothetical protein
MADTWNWSSGGVVVVFIPYRAGRQTMQAVIAPAMQNVQQTQSAVIAPAAAASQRQTMQEVIAPALR